jgi:integrase
MTRLIPQPNQPSLLGSAEIEALDALGRAANRAAAQHTLSDYLNRKANQTRRRHAADLALFADYLAEVGAPTAEAMTRFAAAVAPEAETPPDPAAWRGMTWGIVAAFVQWQLKAGYAIATVNARLSAVKIYVTFANQAGVIPHEEAALIRTVRGYRPTEGKRLNQRRPVSRLGRKKARPVSLTRAQARQLKDQPDTPQGRRDRLLMCLLLDHGLRCGEVAALKVAHLNLERSELRFYRSKVDRVQTHRLTPDTLAAARAYLEQDAPAAGPLLRGSRKNGSLAEPGWAVQNITARVRTLGETIGVEGLSAHDCRHYWATQAARSGTPLDRLQDAGGWASLAMPARYIETARIANQGVLLDE